MNASPGGSRRDEQIAASSSSSPERVDSRERERRSNCGAGSPTAANLHERPLLVDLGCCAGGASVWRDLETVAEEQRHEWQLNWIAEEYERRRRVEEAERA